MNARARVEVFNMKKSSKLLIALLAWLPGYVLALDLTLSIQPILPRQQIEKAYQPLADYLTAITGHNVRVRAHSNFITYWSEMRRARPRSLVLDAAHFTDYRVQKQNFDILAKLPETVSFTIVTHEDDLIFDADELVLKKVATMVSPSVGGIRLTKLFADPMQQPRIIYASDANDAVDKVLSRIAFAAIIPSALVSRYEGLNSVVTTDPLPHMAVSASPDIPPEVRLAIKQALLNAKDTEAGRRMLEQLNFVAFEDANAAVYKGYASLLKDVLGY